MSKLFWHEKDAKTIIHAREFFRGLKPLLRVPVGAKFRSVDFFFPLNISHCLEIFHSTFLTRCSVQISEMQR